MRCVVQSIATFLNLVFQAWNSRPEQGRRTGNMRSGHRRPAGKRIGVIGAVVARTRVSARRRNIGFDAIAAISRDWAAAAKASYRI
jgi:hypothetical protein